MLFGIKSLSQTSEIIYFRIDTIGIRLNQEGSPYEKSPTPGAIAVLDLGNKIFTVLYKDELIYYKIEVEQDSTSIPDPKIILNRHIKMKGIDSEGNSGVIVVFLGTKSLVMKSFVFNEQRAIYYRGKIKEY